MKKYILLLFMITGFLQAQTLQNPTFGNTTTNTLKIKTPATVTSVNFLPTVEADFSLAKIDPVLLPLSTATVNAINVQDATVVHKTGTETIQDKKTFTLSSLTEAEAAVTIKRQYSGVATDKVATLILLNEGEVTGSQGYQNEVNLFLKAGETKNWRRYLGFLNFDDSIAWLTGSNAFNDWILYDSSKTKHNILIQGTTGDFFINSVGAIKMNSDPLAASSSQGLEIYDGTIGQTVPTWKFTGTGSIQKNGNNLYTNPLVSGSIGASGTLLFSSGTTTSPAWGQSSSLDFSFGGITAKKNVTNYFVPQIIGVSVSEPTKKINLGINTATNIGYFQAVNEGVTVLPIAINPNGGRVIFGKSTDNGIDSGQFNSTVSGSAATLSNQFVIKSQLDLKADSANPTFTGSGSISSNFSVGGTLSMPNGNVSFTGNSSGFGSNPQIGRVSNHLAISGSIANASYVAINTDNLTVSRSWTIADKSGTVAMTSDIPLFYTNSTTVALSSATLTSTYPLATIGSEVHAVSIIAGAMIYKKTATEWVQFPVTVTP